MYVCWGGGWDWLFFFLIWSIGNSVKGWGWGWGWGSVFECLFTMHKALGSYLSNCLKNKTKQIIPSLQAEWMVDGDLVFTQDTLSLGLWNQPNEQLNETQPPKTAGWGGCVNLETSKILTWESKVVFIRSFDWYLFFSMGRHQKLWILTSLIHNLDLA